MDRMRRHERRPQLPGLRLRLSADVWYNDYEDPPPSIRGLIAQAIVNGMTLVTPDPEIACFPVPILW